MDPSNLYRSLLPGQQMTAVKLLQLSDTHLFAKRDQRLKGVDTYETLQAIVALASREEGCQAAVLTGDLSQDETAESYLKVAELVSGLNLPVYALPGNHDEKAHMHEIFGRSAADIRLAGNFRAGGWLVVLLDSAVPGKVEGHVCTDELARLEGLLQDNQSSHTIIFLHHNPMPVGAVWIDDIGVTNAEQFFDVVDRYRQVRAIVCGHVHQEFAGERNGIKLLSTPSTCVQFKPRAAEFAVDELPPGFRIIELSEDGNVGTAVKRLDRLPAGLDLSRQGY